MDESLILAGHFLEDIANDSQKVECLDRFSKCKDIVKWLKDETKGKDYKTFNTILTNIILLLLCNLQM